MIRPIEGRRFILAIIALALGSISFPVALYISPLLGGLINGCALVAAFITGDMQ